MSGETAKSNTRAYPACSNSESNTFYGKLPSKMLPGYHAEINACRKCKTLFTWPVNSREELDGFYGELFTSKVGKVLSESSETRRQMAISLYAGVEKLLTRGGDTLDVGSGFGDWLQLLHEKNLYDGIEPSKEMAEMTRARCPWARIFDAAAEDIGEIFSDKKFNLITMIAVIEHLRDPGLVIRNISLRLKPGGKTVLVYPRIDSYPARLLGKKWHLFSPVAHLTLFSKRGLIHNLHSTGLQVISSRFLRQYYSLKYILSLAGFFFPGIGPFAGAVRNVNVLNKMHLRIYTGIDILIAQKGPK
jgi:2-polyprenyl-3-methyl-5-hydroxy-6-metoxy-1,4-benzoquinol methylase